MRAAHPIALDLDRVLGGTAAPATCEDLQRQFDENRAKTGPEYYFDRWRYRRYARWNLADAQELHCPWARDVSLP
jgi:hypothetical protein